MKSPDTGGDRFAHLPSKSVGILVVEDASREWFLQGDYQEVIAAIRNIHSDQVHYTPSMFVLDINDPALFFEFTRWLADQDYIVVWYPDRTPVPVSRFSMLDNCKATIYLVSHVEARQPILVPWAGVVSQFKGKEA